MQQYTSADIFAVFTQLYCTNRESCSTNNPLIHSQTISNICSTGTLDRTIYPLDRSPYVGRVIAYTGHSIRVPWPQTSRISRPNQPITYSPRSIGELVRQHHNHGEMCLLVSNSCPIMTIRPRNYSHCLFLPKCSLNRESQLVVSVGLWRISIYYDQIQIRDPRKNRKHFLLANNNNLAKNSTLGLEQLWNIIE